MKKLIICCDGTWNSEGLEEEGAPKAKHVPIEVAKKLKSGTNVWRLYDLLLGKDANGVEQRSFYLPGVGTDV